MTNKAEQALTLTWQLASRLGASPSNSTVMKFVRDLGIAFGDAEAKQLLKQLRLVPVRPDGGPGLVLESRTIAPSAPKPAPGLPLETDPKSVAFETGSDERARAAKDLVGVDSLEIQAGTRPSSLGGGEANANAFTPPPPAAPLPLGLELDEPASPPPSKPSRRRTPSDEEIAGWAIRDAIAARVAPHLRAMTISSWRAVWSRTALDMARAGVTPEDAVAAWDAHYERTGTRLFKLSALQERMVLDAAREHEDPLAGVVIDFRPVTREARRG